MTRHGPIPVLATLFLLAGGAAAQAQTLKLTRYTIDGGGGEMSGGSLSLHSTLGQADAGTGTGGTLEMTAGFWVPDAVVVPAALQPEPDGVDKNRFITFAAVAAPAGSQTAVRVTLVKLYDEGVCPPRGESLPDLSAFETQVRWLGPPAAYSEDTTPPMLDLVAAPLQCEPYFRDWSVPALAAEFGPAADTTRVHVYGREIVPCSTFSMQAVSSTCPNLAESCFSSSLMTQTALWGDVWAPYALVNFMDIGALVEKFKGLPAPSAPGKAQAMLRGNLPPVSEKINFIDIGGAVDAFKTIAYKEEGPVDCT